MVCPVTEEENRSRPLHESWTSRGPSAPHGIPRVLVMPRQQSQPWRVLVDRFWVRIWEAVEHLWLILALRVALPSRRRLEGQSLTADV
jgi:hypothetical protein